MLEIVFDESQNNTFLGQSYSRVKVNAPSEFSFTTYRLAAANFVAEHFEQVVVLVDFVGSEEERNYFALALCVETYQEAGYLESVVFKVSESERAFASYRYFVALANSIRYARDLLRMPSAEMYADIKRLGYLGLEIKEDYLKNELIVKWLGKEPFHDYYAHGVDEAVIYIAFIKALAIIRHPMAKILTIKIENSGLNMSEDEIINNIVNMVRNENEKR